MPTNCRRCTSRNWMPFWKEGQAKFAFVDYDPPAFVVVSKQMVLQMTMKNTARFDPEKPTSISAPPKPSTCFVAPKLKDLLERIPAGWPVHYYDFSRRESVGARHRCKERSEAIEFLLPKDLSQSLANSEITNQELLDKGQILVKRRPHRPQSANSRNSHHTLRAFWPGADPRAIPAHSHCMAVPSRPHWNSHVPSRSETTSQIPAGSPPGAPRPLARSIVDIQ